MGGCESSCENISRGVFAGNGRQPVSRKYAIVARLYWSASGPTSSPDSASGATYISVPTKNPARVSRCSGDDVGVRRDAEIEQLHLTRDAGSYITLSGLRSRWTMPTECAAWTASAICLTIAHTSSAGSGPCRLAYFSRISPAAHSIARKCMPGTGFADLDRANDVGMLHALAVASFAKKSRDRGAVLAQLLAQNLDGDGAVVGMLCAENGGSSAFSHFALQANIRRSSDRRGFHVARGEPNRGE